MFKAVDYRGFFGWKALVHEYVLLEIARVITGKHRVGDRNPLGVGFSRENGWVPSRHHTKFETLKPSEQAPVEIFDAIQVRATALLDPRSSFQAQHEISNILERLRNVEVSALLRANEQPSSHKAAYASHKQVSSATEAEVVRKAVGKKDWTKMVRMTEPKYIDEPYFEQKAQERIVMTSEQNSNAESAAATAAAGIFIALCDYALIWFYKGVHNTPGAAVGIGAAINAAWVAWVGGCTWEVTHKAVLNRINNRKQWYKAKTSTIYTTTPTQTGWSLKKIVALGIAIATLSHIGEITRVAAPVAAQTWNAIYTSLHHNEQLHVEFHDVEPVAITVK